MEEEYPETAKPIEMSAQSEKMDGFIQNLNTNSQVDYTLDVLSDQIFTPWNDQQNKLNKLYFADNGGIKAIVNIATLPEVNHKTLKRVGCDLWNFAETCILF